jgi:phosphatidylglycerol---prolipoprotein diacylglyceryl transferase
MTLGVNPVAFNIGPVDIRWYGIMVVLAVVAIVAITLVEARRMKVVSDHVYGFAAWAIISGIFFARVFHIIDHWSYYMQNPGQIVGFEGVAVYGAVFGVLLAIGLYCYFKKLSVWQIGDMVSPGALVGMAIGRVGCVLNGCCYGLPNNSAISITYTNPASYAPINVAMYPTQEFHIIWDLMAFGIVWALRKKIKPQGSILLLYLALYSAGDLTIRMFREGTPFMFGLQEAQLIGIAGLLITVPWLVIRMVRYNRKAVVETETVEVEK